MVPPACSTEPRRVAHALRTPTDRPRERLIFQQGTQTSNQPRTKGIFAATLEQPLQPDLVHPAAHIRCAGLNTTISSSPMVLERGESADRTAAGERDTLYANGSRPWTRRKNTVPPRKKLEQDSGPQLSTAPSHLPGGTSTKATATEEEADADAVTTKSLAKG